MHSKEQELETFWLEANDPYFCAMGHVDKSLFANLYMKECGMTEEDFGFDLKNEVQHIWATRHPDNSCICPECGEYDESLHDNEYFKFHSTAVEDSFPITVCSP